MVQQAQARWGRDNIGNVTVTHPGDTASRVSIARGDFGRVSKSPQYLLFEGSTGRSEEHTSELQSLMRISYAVFCLKKKKQNTTKRSNYDTIITLCTTYYIPKIT